MKKNIMFALAAIAFASCGGGSSVDPTDAKSLQEAATQMAVEAIPEAESPFFGTLPSLNEQCKAACNCVDSIYDAERKKLVQDESADESEVRAKFSKMHDARVEARAAIKEAYKQKYQEAGKPLVGKSIPTEFDEAQFSNVKATITGVGDLGTVNCDVEFTLAKPIAKFGVAPQYVFLNSSGEETDATGFTPYKELKNEAGATTKINSGQDGRKLADAVKMRLLVNID